MSGIFITIEGIEGVGKSSNVQFIANELKNRGKEVIITREPGGTPLAEDLRKILLAEYKERTLPKTELLLLYAGRLQHVEEVIKPALKAGKWVICDRFIDATIAYQGAGRGIAMDLIANLNQWALGNFTPDYTIILDAPVEIALTRIKSNRHALDRFEKEEVEFFERIRQGYLELAKQSERYHVINAAEPLLKVQEQLGVMLNSLRTDVAV